MGDIICYNRARGIEEPERVLGDRLMRLAYSTPCRRALGWALFGTAFCSRLLGWYAERGISRRRIAKTISDLQIDMSDFEVPQEGFRNFNEFFARRVKPGARVFPDGVLCSPSDSRLTVYPELKDELCIPVKGADFTISELLFGLNRPTGDERWNFSQEFQGGSLCVFRLCPSDYHRYHFTDDGNVLDTWRLPGGYHTVNPIALEQRIRVFTGNVRQVTMIELMHFGRVAYVEVGAFGVGSIRQTYDGTSFRRGDEKGYFTFGGSTIIMVFQKGAVKYDADILERSAAGVECLVKAGERIGE